MKKNFDTTSGKVIYPMSMLSEVVGNNRTVEIASAGYEFDRTEPYFAYKEGVRLESLSETLAQFAMKEMGYTKYAE